jgi:hypothetical protein
MAISDTFKNNPVGWRKGRPNEDVLFAPVYPIKGGSTAVEPVTNGAQSPAASPAAFQHGATGERVFTEADIAKARKEEKDKLYTEIESLKTQFSGAQKTLQEIQDQKAQELAAVEQKQTEKLAAETAKKEEEMSAKALLEKKLQETTSTWEEKFSQLQAERDAERALSAKERQYNDLVDYRNTSLQNNVADIAPQFHGFIKGDSKEEIDTAIAQAKEATQSIANEVAEARQQQMAQQRGVAPTGYTALGPLDGAVGQKTYTPEDINAMSMAEYAKFRQESGLAGNDAARQRGILG